MLAMKKEILLRSLFCQGKLLTTHLAELSSKKSPTAQNIHCHWYDDGRTNHPQHKLLERSCHMNSKQEYFAAANSEPRVTIDGMTTGREFSVREYTYGVLVPDSNHPLLMRQCV